MARIRETPFLDQPRSRRGESAGGKPDCAQPLFAREIAAAARELFIEKLIQGGHAQLYAKIGEKQRFLHTYGAWDSMATQLRNALSNHSILLKKLSLTRRASQWLRRTIERRRRGYQRSVH